MSMSRSPAGHTIIGVPGLEYVVLGKGGEMNNPRYPLFLLDLDNYFYLVLTAGRLSSTVEVNDVDELNGWDASGRAVALKLVDGDVYASIINESIQIDRLISAILNFAELYGDAKPDDADEDWQDPLKLFRWAEEKVEYHRRSRRLSVRLIRFIKSFFAH
jgi:hypothetical protein